MYLWDTNILRYFGKGHPNLRRYLRNISWMDIALPSVVVAEVLRGRCEFALKSTPQEAPRAHQLLIKTQNVLNKFEIVLFDDKCAAIMIQFQKQYKTDRRYVDIMIAAMTKAGNHILVTRNLKHFKDLLPSHQLENWIDD